MDAKIKVLEGCHLPFIKDIEDFEELNCFLLPQSLKKFLIAYNPVYIDKQDFFLNGHRNYIDRFYPFDKSYEISLQSTYHNLKEHLSNRYIAFANDPGGWQYVISVETSSFGEIFLCRMDDVIPGSLLPLFGSFEEFIDSLKNEV